MHNGSAVKNDYYYGGRGDEYTLIYSLWFTLGDVIQRRGAAYYDPSIHKILNDRQ
jgi:hypothetical protein